MPLTIQNADQTINTQEELKLFMGSLMNAIGTVQTAQGKHDPELEKIANAVQAKMGAWNKLDEQSFSLPEVRRELKKDILKPISDYVKDITIRAPKDIMTQIRLAERERSKVEDTILKAEDEYDRLKQGDSKKVALGKAIDEMIRTQLRPAEEKVEQFKSVWENHPDNKRAQLRRELENRNVFSKYAAHVASGPNLRLRAPKTAAESIQLGDYLRGLGNVLRTEGTGPNALHSSKKGGNDPELQSILNSFTDLSSSDYAKGVSAAGAEYDASKDPVWFNVRRFSDWMGRNYGMTAQRNITELMDTYDPPEELVDYSAPTYGLDKAKPQILPYQRRNTTAELFSRENLNAAPAEIGNKLSGQGVAEDQRVLHEAQLYSAFSKVLHEAEERAFEGRIGHDKIPEQMKGARLLIKEADKLMATPGLKLQKLAEIDIQEQGIKVLQEKQIHDLQEQFEQRIKGLQEKEIKEKREQHEQQIKDLKAMNPEYEKQFEDERKAANALAGDPKVLFEGLSALMDPTKTDPEFIEILKESFLDNRALFEAEKDFLPDGFMEDLRRGARERGLEDQPVVAVDQPVVEEKKDEQVVDVIQPAVDEEKKEEIKKEEPAVDVIQPAVEEVKKEEEKKEEPAVKEVKKEEEKQDQQDAEDEGPLVEDSKDDSRPVFKAEINQVYEIKALPRDELADMINGRNQIQEVNEAGPGVNVQARRNSAQLADEIRSAATAGQARNALETLLDGMGRVFAGRRPKEFGDFALQALMKDAENLQKRLDKEALTAGKELKDLPVSERNRKRLEKFAGHVAEWSGNYPDLAKTLDARLEGLDVTEVKQEEEKNPEDLKEEEKKPEDKNEILEENLNSINIIEENPNRINIIKEDQDQINTDKAKKPSQFDVIQENPNRINIINDESASKPSFVRTERGLLEDFPVISTAEQYGLFLTSLKETFEHAKAEMQKEGALDALSREDRIFMHRHVNFGDGKDWKKDPMVTEIARNVSRISGNGTVTIDGLIDTVNKELEWNSTKKGKLSKQDEARASKTRYALNRLVQYGKDDVLKDFVRDGVRNYTSPALQSEVSRSLDSDVPRIGGIEGMGRIRTKEQLSWYFGGLINMIDAGQRAYSWDLEVKKMANTSDKQICLSEGGKIEDTEYGNYIYKEIMDRADMIEKMNQEDQKGKKKKRKADSTERSFYVLAAMQGVLSTEVSMLEGTEDGSLSSGAQMKAADLRRVCESVLENDITNKTVKDYVGMYIRNVGSFVEKPKKAEKKPEKKPEELAENEEVRIWKIMEDGEEITLRKKKGKDIEVLDDEGNPIIDTYERDETGRRVFGRGVSCYEEKLYYYLEKNKNKLTPSQLEDKQLLYDYNYEELRKKHGVPEDGIKEEEEAEKFLEDEVKRGFRPVNNRNPVVPPVNNGNPVVPPVNVNVPPAGGQNIPPVQVPDLPPVIRPEANKEGQQKKDEVGLDDLINKEKNGDKPEEKPEIKKAPPAYVTYKEETPKLKLGETGEGGEIEMFLPVLKENCEKLRLSMEKEKRFEKGSNLLPVKNWLLQVEETAGNIIKNPDRSAAQYANDMVKLSRVYHRLSHLEQQNIKYSNKKGSLKEDELIRKVTLGLTEGLHSESNQSIPEKKKGQKYDPEFELAKRTLLGIGQVFTREKNTATLKAADRALRPEYTDRLLAAADHMKELNKAPKENKGAYLAFYEKLQQFAGFVRNKNADVNDPEGKQRKQRISEAALELRNAAAQYFNGRGVSKKGNSLENQQYNCGLYCLMLLDPDLAKTLGRKAQGKYDMTDSVHLKYENIVHNEGELLKTYVPKYKDKRTDPKTTDDFRKLATQENVDSLVSLYDMMEREDNTFHWRSGAYKTLMEKLGELKNANRHFLDQNNAEQADAMAQRLKDVKEALDAYVPKHVGKRYSNDNRRFNISLSMQYLLAPEAARQNAARSQTLNPDLSGGLKLAGRNEKLTLDRLALCVTGAAKQKNSDYLLNEKKRKTQIKLKNFEEELLLKQKEQEKNEEEKSKGKKK